MLNGLAIGFASLSAMGCSGEERTVGQLVVSVDSDMALPDQVDTVRIEVLVRGGLQFANDYQVGQNALLLPATLTLVAGEDPSTPVTVRVIGKKGPRARTLRETTTTIPEGRVAALPMPVQWLCDDRVDLDDEGELISTCGEGYTCSGGRCVEQDVPAPKLLDYTPETVFGGAPTADGGTCFDTLDCMATGTIVEPDIRCRVKAPSGGLGVNVALRVIADGICDAKTGACLVPLPADSEDGFREDEEGLALPRAVCDRLHSGRVSAVVVSTRCPTRPASRPACGSWSSVTALPEQAPEPRPPAPPEPELLSSFADRGGHVCCNLFADAKQFYGCVCNGSGPVQVVRLDPRLRTATSIASFDPIDKERKFFATTLVGDELVWVDREAISNRQDNMLVQATSLVSGETRLVASIKGDIRNEAELASDGSKVYAIAAIVGDDGSGGQLVTLDVDTGHTQPLALNAENMALRVAQDEISVYVATTTDYSNPQVTSRIYRVSKQAGTHELFSEIEVGGGDETSGYSSLVMEDDRLLAISLDTTFDDGTATLLAFDQRGGTEPLYAQRIEPQQRRVSILGAEDGVVVLSRSQTTTDSDGNSSLTSSLLLVPETGAAPRLAIEYRDEEPRGRLLVPEFDPDTLYWMTTRGNVYRLPREALNLP